MDKGSEVIKIVEWNLKGQGVCFIFRTAERTFPTAECMFPTAECMFPTAECMFPIAECTFRSGEYKQETLYLQIHDGFI